MRAKGPRGDISTVLPSVASDHPQPPLLTVERTASCSSVTHSNSFFPCSVRPSGEVGRSAASTQHAVFFLSGRLGRMLGAPPTPVGPAVLIGWLLRRPLCLFTLELSVGPSAGVAANVQNQHPSSNQRLIINTRCPRPRPPGDGGDSCSSLPSAFPSRIHPSPNAHRGHLLHKHTPFPAVPSLALHLTLLLVFPGVVSQGGHLSLNPSQGLLPGKRKLRQSPCLCKWFSCSWLGCMCVC